MPRMRPIGEDEDEADCEGPQNVGSGSASLTAVEDTRGHLNHATRIALKLRKAGATYVKIGEFEVSFVAPVEAKP